MRKFTKYFGYTTQNTTEGGSSRNSAIMGEIAKTNCVMHIYYPTNILSRILKGMCLLTRFLFYKKENIFIHYTALRHLFTDHLLSNKYTSHLITSIIKYAGSRNDIVFEINDLPHEQSKDLELPANRLDLFDNQLYRLKNVYFVFASISMKEYVQNKYCLDSAMSSVLINGAPQLLLKKSKIQDQPLKEINFVYAGSLNKGRQIEQLINIFKDMPHNLFLLGDGGNWLTTEVVQLKNIKYLGSKTESEALDFVSSCDVGLIPYDDSKFYYNICFPTKASFYICAGIPFLSTNLQELKLHFNNDVALYAPLSNWGEIIDSTLTHSYIIALSKNVETISANYSWNTLINNWLRE